MKDSNCCDNLQELNVLETVKRNWRKFELDSEIIGSLYMQIQKNANDSNRVIFTETSSPSNNSFCSQEHTYDSRQPNILLLRAPTGASAININGKTTHSALNIPINGRFRNLET